MALKNAVVVTGGAGYIGTHVCHFLKEAGYTPIIIDDCSTGSADQAKKVADHHSLDVDISDKEKLEQTLQYWKSAGEIRAVIHMAAKTSVPEGQEQPHAYYKTNGLGTLNMAWACERLHIPTVIYSSTAAVYGTTTGPSEEWHTPAPTNVYGRSKLLGEQFLREHYSGRCVIFRYFNVAGALPTEGLGDTRGDSKALVPSLIRSGRAGSVFNIYGDGSAVRDFVHVADLAKAHVLAISNENARGVINVGYGVATPVSKIIELSKTLCPELQVECLPRRAGDVAFSQAGISNLTRMLRFYPSMSLADILATEYAWQNIQK